MLLLDLSQPELSDHMEESRIDSPPDSQKRIHSLNEHTSFLIGEESVDFQVEGNFAYFVPIKANVRNIIGEMLSFKLGLKAKIYRSFFSYFSGGYSFSRKASLSKNCASFYAIPCELGVLASLKTGIIEPCFGLGGVVSYNRVDNIARCGPSIQSAWSFGGLFKVGVLSNLGETIFCNLFFNYYLYSDAKFRPSAKKFYNKSVDLSGYSLSFGIGYSF
ncbi:MAG TPA: hypothetical protein PKW79_02400 [Rhabdochlamydiaceae bacterium]|nr:hypothetical protein [Rhabdochlamydiaceae bacterium]